MNRAVAGDQASGARKMAANQITIRIRKEIVEVLQPGVPAKIRALIESKYKALAIIVLLGMRSGSRGARYNDQNVPVGFRLSTRKPERY